MKGLTDSQVEKEISRLLESEDVHLAKMEMAHRYRRRQYLYKLRGLEKRGAELRKSGITEDVLTEVNDATEE